MTLNSRTFSTNLDQKTRESILEVSELGSTQNIPLFLIGATARDILLSSYNIPTGPRTRDIDFGVQVASWEQFQLLREGLLNANFIGGNAEHRLQHQNGFEIDIVPFGPIADTSGKIYWPDNNQHCMSVLGYDDAYKCADSLVITSEHLSHNS